MIFILFSFYKIREIGFIIIIIIIAALIINKISIITYETNLSMSFLRVLSRTPSNRTRLVENGYRS